MICVHLSSFVVSPFASLQMKKAPPGFSTRYTVDDAVCGLISILDAMNTGDNDRFHLETLHHSKQEIRRILERGGKIDRTVEYAVDDEDEEYDQYHGFSMRM